MSGDRTLPRQFEIVASTRRRWSAEQKRAIVNEIAAVGGSVSEVARRHGMHTSLLFRWRRDLRAGRDNGAHASPAATPKFLPVKLPPPRGETSSLARSGAIEIALAGGRTVRVGSDVDIAALVRIIEALEERR
jgi:transposase